VQLDQIKEYVQDCENLSWQSCRKQASLKSGKAGIQTQIDSLKAKIEREQNDLKAKRGKINYRSTDEIDREIMYLSLSSKVSGQRLIVVILKKKLKLVLWD